ncbi:MAG TPA: carbohydrate porin [Geothrix sp.]|uniref:maltoporin n=1 Tax=Geothrix mesophila TaxID=2922723 RepID=UPI001FAB91E8|nr:carbohydrate porin [Geothrix sp. SG198]HJV39607.1 carbohydrate porin [Geothrix sp.]
MKSLSLIKAALPLALACGPLLAQDVVEIHGYTRMGVGRSSNGGEQVSFFMANTGGAPTNGPGYRLGNETDNYLELAVDVKAYEKGNTTFKLHFRPTFRQFYQVRDASADAGGNVDNSKVANPNQMVYLRETWGEATGIFGNSGPFKDASLWAGRRFYMRQDLHIRDQWYWNNSGDGVGIENIDFGALKLHYAYIQHDTGNLGSDWNNGAILGTVNPYSQWVGGGGHTIVGSHDLRVSDIKLWEGGSLTFGVQYNDARTKTGYENDGNKNNGIQYNLIVNQAGVLGGDNRVYATWGNGSTYWNWYNPDVKTENNWWHVMDIFYIKPVSNLEMQGVVQYRKQNGKGTMEGTTNAWTSVGVRPTYFFTKHFSVAYEVGFDKLKFDNEDEARKLLKNTIALQWSPQASFWSRPVIRLFVTRADWNKNANNWNLIGEGQFGNSLQGLTFGAQVEAWW